mmetsp:Transcript_88106/g.262714  ORF Transcript_88106/g.262714 Transcript_88106/m.262714 type:complete len:204 (-) Transcript_88106:334-945(-)
MDTPYVPESLKYRPFRASFTSVPPLIMTSSSGRLRSVSSRTIASASISSSSSVLATRLGPVSASRLFLAARTLELMSFMAFVSVVLRPCSWSSRPMPRNPYRFLVEAMLADGPCMPGPDLATRPIFTTLPMSTVLSKPVSGGPMSVKGIWQRSWVKMTFSCTWDLSSTMAMPCLSSCSQFGTCSAAMGRYFQDPSLVPQTPRP